DRPALAILRFELALPVGCGGHEFSPWRGPESRQSTAQNLRPCPATPTRRITRPTSFCRLDRSGSSLSAWSCPALEVLGQGPADHAPHIQLHPLAKLDRCHAATGQQADPATADLELFDHEPAFPQDQYGMTTA